MDLNKLLQDEEFKTAIENAAGPEEIAELLRTKGIDVTAGEVENALGTEYGEMSESELETVSGGGWFSSIWSYIKAVRYSAGGGGFSVGGGGKGSFGGGGVGGSR